MLAHSLKDEEINESLFSRGPLYVQPKYDGIRCQAVDGKLYSGRNGKELPNMFCQGWADANLRGLHLDGEMMVVDSQRRYLSFSDKDGQPGIESCLMSRVTNCNFQYIVFDSPSHPGHYLDRLTYFGTELLRRDNSHCSAVTNQIACTVKDIEFIVSHWYNFEGYILRSPLAVYKNGRSTLRELGMLKRKTFTDAEAYVIGFEERMHNHNEATLDIWGLTDRTSHSGNLTPAGDLGAFVVQSNDWPAPFKIGTGFTAAERVKFWNEQTSLYGQCVTYKYQPHGSKDAPRSPVFLRLRNSD